MPSTAEIKQDLAKEALQLQSQMDELTKELNEKKDELRSLANGKKLNIVVEGIGKVDITEPRAGSDKVTFSFDEDKLGKVPELRKKLVDVGIAKEVLVINDEKLAKAATLKVKLLEKGVMTEETKKVSAAKASVRIKPNV